MDVERLRREIPATQRMIYMNSGWSGPSPQVVVERVRERIAYESYEGPTSRPVQDSGRAIRTEARQAFADLLNATPEEITLTGNTTQGINIVLSGLNWQAGDEVITDNLEHSSGLVPAYYLRQRRGVTVKLVSLDAADNGAAILSKLEAAMGPRTRLLLLSHVMYCNGLRLPLKAIQELAHRYGALVLVDAAQSAGHIVADVQDLDCDFYALPAHKWLLGPDGVGALYLRRDLIPQVEPVWVAGRAAASYDLEGGFEPNIESIQKFELTTTSAPLLGGAAAAIRFLEEIGLADIEERVLALAALARKTLSDMPGVTLTSPAGGPEASGLVSFAISGQDPRAVTAALWEQDRIVARSVAYPSGVRLSIDFFNTEQEIDRVAAAVQRIAREGLA